MLGYVWEVCYFLELEEMLLKWMVMLLKIWDVSFVIGYMKKKSGVG